MIQSQNNKKRKVALYIPSMRGGGAERVMLTIANSLVSKGIDVDLVLNKATGPYLNSISPKVKIVNLGTSRVLSSIIPLARYLSKERPNAILSAMNYVNIATVLAQLISRVQTTIVLSEHSNLTETKRGLGLVKGEIITLLMRWTYQKAHAIVAVSNGVADALTEEIGIKRDKIKTIYNPIFTEQLIEDSKQVPSHPWISNKSLPLILSAGRLTNVKGFETLIHAFNTVYKQKHCNLIILGEGELRPKLQELINSLNLENNIQLQGFVDNPYSWMSQADLFVLSSIREGLPTALIEAMACGTQVISTDCPSGPREILEDGMWGILVPPNNSKSLAKAILNTLKNPVKKDVKSRASFFNVDNAVDQYLDLFGFK